jgi:hypothetical protein
MDNSNPYSPPKADVADVDSAAVVDHVRLDRVASGQRLLVISVLISFLGFLPLGLFNAIFVIAAAIVGIVGAVRTSGGLGSHWVMRVVYSLMMILPLFNLLAMARLSAKATKVLRAAGYKVGLLGASRGQFSYR